MEKKKVLIPTDIKVVNKEGKTYYNIYILVEGMKVLVEPKFLNNKQKCLLRHKLGRALGVENNANE